MISERRENRKEITLYSKENYFPITIRFVDRDDTIVNYVLFKTRKGKLILQKPFFGRTQMQQE